LSRGIGVYNEARSLNALMA